MNDCKNIVSAPRGKKKKRLVRRLLSKVRRMFFDDLKKSEMGLRWTSERIEISVSTYCRGTPKHSGKKTPEIICFCIGTFRNSTIVGVNKIENSNGTKMWVPNWNEWQTKRVYTKTIYLIHSNTGTIILFLSGSWANWNHHLVYSFPWCTTITLPNSHNLSVKIPAPNFSHQPKDLSHPLRKCVETNNQLTLVEVLLMEEILHHLGCIKFCKSWDKLPVNWCRTSAINSIMSLIIVYLSTLQVFQTLLMETSQTYPNVCLGTEGREFREENICNNHAKHK